MTSLWSTVWKWVKRVAVAAVVFTALFAIYLYWLVSRSTPDYAVTLAVDGSAGEIEIIRDARATPHIFAGSEQDAFFGLGFAHAQDRFWQMTMARAAAQGRLTTVSGGWLGGLTDREGLIRVDLTLRALDLAGHAERSMAAQGPDTRSALEAYAAGVNAWIASLDDAGLGRGAPELDLLGLDPEPWRPVDSLAVYKLYAAAASARGVLNELRRARYVIALGPERAADLLSPPESGAITTLPEYRALFRPRGGDAAPVRFAARAGAGRADDAGVEAGLSAWLSAASASNAWAVTGARSATRAPLLAADPHLPLTAPSLWHVARIDHPGGGVIGATFPGLPAILAGRNAEIAWGATALYADVADIVIEKVNPDDPAFYKTDGGWRRFETREARIPIGGGDVAAVTLSRTRNGPVLPLDWEAVARVTPTKHVAALSWTVLTDEDRSLQGALRLMRARSVEAALSASEEIVGPPQTLFVGDARDVALAVVGRIPKRDAGHETQGRVPAPGWRAVNAWRGDLSDAETPQVISPPSGVVANANNRITDAAFPAHLGFDWDAPYRIDRLTKLLNNREFHTLKGFRAMQSDVVSEMARAIAPLLARELWPRAGTEAGLRRVALERLARWNGAMDAFLAEPLIFSAWARATVRRLTEDELEDTDIRVDGAPALFLERAFRNVDGAAARWCDDRRTAAEESCDDIASLALDDALAELVAAFGDDIDAWRWGRAHLATHRHAPLSLGWLGPFADIAQESGGGPHTILRGSNLGLAAETPYANEHAGGFRAIYDFADLDRSIYALATGASGHFLSQHYDDQAETWRAGDYAPLSLDRQDAEAGAVGVTRLTPRAR